MVGQVVRRRLQCWGQLRAHSLILYLLSDNCLVLNKLLEGWFGFKGVLLQKRFLEVWHIRQVHDCRIRFLRYRLSLRSFFPRFPLRLCRSREPMTFDVFRIEHLTVKFCLLFSVTNTFSKLIFGLCCSLFEIWQTLLRRSHVELLKSGNAAM